MGNQQSNTKKEEKENENEQPDASEITSYSVEVEYVLRPNQERVSHDSNRSKTMDARLDRLAKKHGGEWTASDVGPFSVKGPESPLTRANNFEFAFRKGSRRGRSQAAASAKDFVSGLPKEAYVDFIDASDRGMDNHYYVFSRRGLDTKVLTEDDACLRSAAISMVHRHCPT